MQQLEEDLRPRQGIFFCMQIYLSGCLYGRNNVALFQAVKGVSREGKSEDRGKNCITVAFLFLADTRILRESPLPSLQINQVDITPVEGQCPRLIMKTPLMKVQAVPVWVHWHIYAFDLLVSSSFVKFVLFLFSEM